jgi:hypothetical protein
MQAEQQMHDFVVATVDMVFGLPFVFPIIALLVVLVVLAWIVGTTRGGTTEIDE